jgi:hypothetical protein
MSRDNTFWICFWAILLLFFVTLASASFFAGKYVKETEKAMYDKCISANMQFVNGNCLYGKGNQ